MLSANARGCLGERSKREAETVREGHGRSNEAIAVRPDALGRTSSFS